jgi:hypothetical protein
MGRKEALYWDLGSAYSLSLPLACTELIVDVPPEITIPDDFPLVPTNLRWAKRFQRAAIELTNLFDRASRQRALVQFDQEWSLREQESLCCRLVSREFQRRYGPSTTFRAATLLFLPKNMSERAKIYQLHARFVQKVNCYRSRFGLSPQDELTQRSPSI